MRTFLFVILVAVAAVLLWAIWSQSYVNTTIFTLGLLATGLCGYLISDYFFNIEKKSGQSDLILYKKEVAALKEELDILRKQSVLATPQTEIDDMKSRFFLLEEEKNKINGDFLAQAATISQLNTRLESLQKQHHKLNEESTVTTESKSTELEAIRDILSTTKTRISELSAENEALRKEIANHKEASTTSQDELESLKMAFADRKEVVSTREIDVTELESLKMELADHKEILATKQLELVELESLRMELADNKDVLATKQLEIAKMESLKKELAQYKEKATTPKETMVETTAPKKENFISTTTTSKTVSNKIEGDAKVVPLAENTERFELQNFRKRTIPNDDNGKVNEVVANPVSDIQTIDNQDIKSEIQEQKTHKTAPIDPHSVQSPHPVYGASDDLKVIEGIGPKIESILKAAGIENWHDLAEASVTNLKGVMEQAGSRYRLNDPSTWPEQARLLSNSEWDKFKIYTDYLIGGRKPKA
jgi:predicted flap endonuclease-1-like 5' DNA nuclease